MGLLAQSGKWVIVKEGKEGGGGNRDWAESSRNIYCVSKPRVSDRSLSAYVKKQVTV